MAIWNCSLRWLPTKLWLQRSRFVCFPPLMLLVRNYTPYVINTCTYLYNSCITQHKSTVPFILELFSTKSSRLEGLAGRGTPPYLVKPNESGRSFLVKNIERQKQWQAFGEHFGGQKSWLAKTKYNKKWEPYNEHLEKATKLLTVVLILMVLNLLVFCISCQRNFILKAELQLPSFNHFWFSRKVGYVKSNIWKKMAKKIPKLSLLFFFFFK